MTERGQHRRLCLQIGREAIWGHNKSKQGIGTRRCVYQITTKKAVLQERIWPGFEVWSAIYS